MKTRLAAALVIALVGGTFMAWRIAPGTARAEQDGRDRDIVLANASGEWVSIGPSPLISAGTTDNFQAGRVSSIAVNPLDPRHWLVGFGNSGIWESRDGGDSWVPLTDGAPTLAIGAVAFAPSNPDIVYAETGEAVSTGIAKAGLGILSSRGGYGKDSRENAPSPA